MTEISAESATRFLEVGVGADARPIAYRSLAGEGPTLVWLGGYRSDMRGTKAERLVAFAAARGLAACRFDYSGHGESGGRFEDGTISHWVEDAEAVLAEAVDGPVILVGSSMGAWIALRLIQRRRAAGASAVRGLLLLAPAPDFTSRLMEPQLTAAQRRALAAEGFIAEPSGYSDEPNVYTRALFEDGRANAVMQGTIETGCPVHIIQGMADPDVPYSHALELVSHLPSDGVILTLVRDGDHRLSREADLLRMEQALDGLVSAARNG
ncbi:alpha/beta hydrolase [Mangrovibrevibacter kandeliae]|uniref:alpha/beta hydrolase n=1 Tax=Mangrovibrevibacter kandeliae TaxID=2968473 RepID=UPI002117FEF6|nr:alpha/beta hydrolase [Aurantimonas sp. CSK15Z-1]MCQ8780594.1 alpha/beta hydrolase [Aurantimonas sp. CSK15Z-1]